MTLQEIHDLEDGTVLKLPDEETTFIKSARGLVTYGVFGKALLT